MALSIVYGMLIVKSHVPPYEFLANIYRTFRSKDYLETPKRYLLTDPAQLISISRAEDVPRLRGALITFLWGAPGLPSVLPAKTAKAFADTRYDGLSALKRIDKLSIAMEFKLDSHVYHFLPHTPNNKVILYHQGHGGDFHRSKDTIDEFLDRGYAVVGFAMPLFGLNSQPTIELPRIGKLKMTTHDHMKYLSPEGGHPVKYFIEPIVVALNYLDKQYAYSSVSMVGISGGAWATTLAAAVDSRIDNSFPVAGSYPIYLRSGSQRDWGDFEQNVPELYKTVNYLELYLLGAYGAGRKQMQVINQYDTCCFAGTKWDTYKGVVQARLQRLRSGKFKLLLDDTHKGHQISEMALGRILQEIASSPPPEEIASAPQPARKATRQPQASSPGVIPRP
jgi:pimeloyl-ACP methyl ester carboxylesterase